MNPGLIQHSNHCTTLTLTAQFYIKSNAPSTDRQQSTVGYIVGTQPPPPVLYSLFYDHKERVRGKETVGEREKEGERKIGIKSQNGSHIDA